MMNKTEIPARKAEMLLAEGEKGAKSARRELAKAWPHRHTNPRAKIAARCNARTLRQFRALGVA